MFQIYPYPPLGARLFVEAGGSNNPKRQVAAARGTYKKWDTKAMERAIATVEKKEATIRKAAIMFNVPKSSLHDRITGKVSFGARSGPTPYLSKYEEEELASFLFRSAKIGYPQTRKKVLYLVQQIIDDKGIDAHVTNGWWERFKQRHPLVVLKTAAQLSNARAVASDHEVIERYYDLLEDTLRQNKIFNAANHIYNCDETGMPLCPKTLKIVTMRGTTSTCTTSDSKSQVTVLACVNAAGHSLPPFVIFSRKTFNRELCTGEIPGTLYGTSENGWMTRVLFRKWFENHFLVYIPKLRPIILLMDGHSSHFCPELIKRAAAEQIVLFTLPPHTTHLTQPLDRGCFSPLKSYWQQVCHDFLSSNPGRVVTVYDFSKLLSDTWLSAMTSKNIMSGFKVTGICPFDHSFISTPNDEYESFKPEQLSYHTGLAHVPLYSPGRRYFNTSAISNLNTSESSSNVSDADDEVPFIKPTSSWIEKYANTQIQTHSSIATYTPRKRIKSCGRVMTSKEIQGEIENRERKVIRSHLIKVNKLYIYLPVMYIRSEIIYH